MKQNFLFQQLINNLPHLLCWKDLNSVFLGCNTLFAQAAGFESPDELIGKTDYDMPWKAKAKDYIRMDQQLIASKKSKINFEETLIYKGVKSTVLTTKAPLFDEFGETIGIFGVCTDISEKKRAESEKASIIQALSRGISHEIRTPLSIIKINADLVQLLNISEHITSPLTERKKFIHNMNNIHQAIKECTQVMDMLTVKLKKIATPPTALDHKNFERCSMLQTFQNALSEYPFRKGEAKCIESFLDKQDFFYKGNMNLMKHVLFNLLKNSLSAIKVAEKGHITVEYGKIKKFNCFILRDTASGIAADYLPKIFDEFETSDDANSGMGLGLAFCKLVMESYGGRIKCRSEINKFTEFTLMFPAINE